MVEVDDEMDVTAICFKIHDSCCRRREMTLLSTEVEDLNRERLRLSFDDIFLDFSPRFFFGSRFDSERLSR